MQPRAPRRHSRSLPGSARAAGPELALEGLLGLLERAGGGAGREVLPAAVRDHEGDVGPLTVTHGLHRLAHRGVQDRAGGDAGEDALLLDQLTGTTQRLARPYREAGR